MAAPASLASLLEDTSEGSELPRPPQHTPPDRPSPPPSSAPAQPPPSRRHLDPAMLDESMGRSAKRAKSVVKTYSSPTREAKASTSARKSLGASSLQATTEPLTSNQDLCDACGGKGHFLCCDGCPRSFHFTCLDPPLDINQIPDDLWFCRVCLAANRPPTFPPKRKDRRSPFSDLIRLLDSRNPKAFSLPSYIRNHYDNVTTALNGDYVDQRDYKAAKLNKFGLHEHRDPYKLHDKDNGSVLCYKCGQASSATKQRKILSCDFCNKHWHLDCLDPPQTTMPPPSRKWLCPVHADPLMPHLRTPKDHPPVPLRGRRNRNNGNIEILPTPRKKEPSPDWEELQVNGLRYQVPEDSLILDFWDRIHGKRLPNNTKNIALSDTSTLSPPGSTRASSPAKELGQDHIEKPKHELTSSPLATRSLKPEPEPKPEPETEQLSDQQTRPEQQHQVSSMKIDTDFNDSFAPINGLGIDVPADELSATKNTTSPAPPVKRGPGRPPKPRPDNSSGPSAAAKARRASQKNSPYTNSGVANDDPQAQPRPSYKLKLTLGNANDTTTTSKHINGDDTPSSSLKGSRVSSPDPSKSMQTSTNLNNETQVGRQSPSTTTNASSLHSSPNTHQTSSSKITIRNPFAKRSNDDEPTSTSSLSSSLMVADNDRDNTKNFDSKNGALDVLAAAACFPRYSTQSSSLPSSVATAQQNFDTHFSTSNSSSLTSDPTRLSVQSLDDLKILLQARKLVQGSGTYYSNQEDALIDFLRAPHPLVPISDEGSIPESYPDIL